MDRRVLIATGLAALGSAGAAFAQPERPPGDSAPGPARGEPGYPVESGKAETYSNEEMVSAVSDFFGVTVSGRPASLPGAAEMIGLFINTLPLRVGSGRGLALVDWLAEVQQQQADLREYGLGAQILVDLGVREMRLMTNNPKKVVGLESYGLKIVERVPIEAGANEVNAKYLQTKKEKLGHIFGKNGGA